MRAKDRLPDIVWRFELFHAENPHVYAQLLEIARTIHARGKRLWGISAIYERLRWVSEFETEGDVFKLNNNFKPFYSRMLMKEPDLAGFFRVRPAAADVML